MPLRGQVGLGDDGAQCRVAETEPTPGAEHPAPCLLQRDERHHPDRLRHVVVDAQGCRRDLDSVQDLRHNAIVTRETFADHAVVLRQHGVQVTAQRLAVLRAVIDRPHSSADDIDGVVRAELGAVSRQAVYDALGVLTDRGLLRRIQPAGSPARYEDRVGDNHHHLICRTCGRMVDVDCAVGYTPCLSAADDSGYEVDEAEVIYWGRCPACVAATSEQQQSPR